MPVCPEVDIGLGIPRKPINLYHIGSDTKVIQSDTGMDLTVKLSNYCQEYLKYAGSVDGFILKSKSPSCGIMSTPIQIKNKGESYSGSGVFAMIAQNMFPQGVFVDEIFLEQMGVNEFLKKLS
jgi:uncharacterized protein YbbK (DUF523 family)